MVATIRTLEVDGEYARWHPLDRAMLEKKVAQNPCELALASIAIQDAWKSVRSNDYNGDVLVIDRGRE